MIEPDGARALMLAVRGELDVIPALAPVHHPEVLTAPGIKGDFLPLELEPPAFEMLALDATRPPFDDARVREAVSVALDRDKIARDLAGGLARPIAVPVWPHGPIDGPAPAVPRVDLARAGALLGAAGWIDTDGDGVRERAGTRLRTSFLAIADLQDDAEREIVLAALRSIGFLVDVLPGEAGFLATRLRAGGYGAAIVSVRTGPGDDLSPLLGRAGKDNPSVATSAALDAALDATLPTLPATSAEARLQAAEQVAELLATDWPIVGIVAPRPVGLVHRRVRGLVPWGGWFALDGVTLAPEAPR